ncbi:MAG: AMP-binding protein [Opitutales bacterium]
MPSGGDNEALVDFSGKAPSRESFDAILETADKLSAGLRQRERAEMLERPIILFSPASIEAIIAAVGILRAGGIVAPLDTQMPDEDLLHVLKNADARLVLTTERLWQRLNALEGGPDLEGFLLDIEADESKENDASPDSGSAASWHKLFKDPDQKPATPDPKDTAVLFYTSGTTGPPKGVPLSHENILFQIETVIQTGLIKADDRVLQPLPLHHVYPFVIGTLAPLTLGLPIILPGALTGKALATALQVGEATVTLGVPRLYQAFFGGLRDRIRSMPGGRVLLPAALGLAKAGKRVGLPLGHVLFRAIRKKAAPRLRLLASGGSALEPGLAENLEALGWPVAIGYGLTETAPLLTIKKPGEATYDSVGRAVDGVELRVDPAALETDGEDDPDADRDDNRGELLARGPNVFSGYHDNATATRKSFTESGWFRTGDVATIDPDGVVYLSGRVSTRIALQGGENIDPARLEAHYAETDGVEEIGILEYEGKLAALVVPDKELRRDNAPETTADKLRKALKRQGRGLPSYQQLSAIEVSTRELARTRLGKLRRHELEKAFEEARKGEADQSTKARREVPLPEAELSSQDKALLENKRARALWELLCERYADRPVAPDAELGGDLGIDSLEWVELSLAIEAATGASVDEAMIARVDRVRDLLEAITEAEESGGEQVTQSLRNPESALNESERKWTQARGPVRWAMASIFFAFVYAYLHLRLRVRATGLDNLPSEGPCILTPNHLSYLDAPCLAVTLGYRRARRFFWAGSTEVMFRNIFTREISRLAQVVPIDARRGPISSLTVPAYVLHQNHPLVWFPEGRISPDGSLQDFQPGIGLLLKQRDLPIIPVRIEGTDEALPKGRRLPRRGEVNVRFGEALETSALRGDDGEKAPVEVAKALREAVQDLSEPSTGEEDTA